MTKILKDIAGGANFAALYAGTTIVLEALNNSQNVGGLEKISQAAKDFITDPTQLVLVGACIAGSITGGILYDKYKQKYR